MTRSRLCFLCAVALAAGASRRARATQIVQIPVDAVLNARPVATLAGGALVPWTVGIDQDDGFITTAAAKSLHQTDPALPDDGAFPADTHHPAVVLHFSNAAPATGAQARSVTGAATFAFDVPAARYETLFLFLTSSYGDTKLEVTFHYADATTTTAAFTMPDWGTGAALPAGPPAFFNLISGLHKWTKSGASVDTPTHALAGVALTPAPDETLVRVEIAKTSATPWLTFWGATGVATSVPDADAGAPTDAAPADVPPVDAGHAANDAGGEAPPARDASADRSTSPADVKEMTPVDASAPIDAAHARSSSSGGCGVAGSARRTPRGLAVLAALVALARTRRRR